MPNPIIVDQKGLKWTPYGIGLDPQWTMEPSINAISKAASRALNLSKKDTALGSISFLTEGGSHKIYTFRCSRGTFIMRVALPVCPHLKTRSEAGAIEFVRANTDIPVPEMFAFEATSANEIGFEWILESRVEREALYDVWVAVGWEARYRLVDEMVDVMVELFRMRGGSIGGVYEVDEEGEENTELDMLPLIQGAWRDIPRGPFGSSAEWMRSRLLFVESDCVATIEKYGSEDKGEVDAGDVEEARQILVRVERLRELLPHVFDRRRQGTEPCATSQIDGLHLGESTFDHPSAKRASVETSGEEFCLHHWDLNMGNIMVDTNCKLSGISDWEGASFMPLWKACQPPCFLEDRPMDKEPAYDRYFDGKDDSPNNIYQEKILRCEQTILRKYFFQKMAEKEPAWMEVYHTSVRTRNFDVAVDQCDQRRSCRDVDEWLDQFETEGSSYDLRYDRSQTYREIFDDE